MPMAIAEFAEDDAPLIRTPNNTNAHTQNASEGSRPRADKFYLMKRPPASRLHDPLFQVKRITDHSHNIRARAPPELVCGNANIL
jgi:hypothetical protein